MHGIALPSDSQFQRVSLVESAVCGLETSTGNPYRLFAEWNGNGQNHTTRKPKGATLDSSAREWSWRTSLVARMYAAAQTRVSYGVRMYKVLSLSLASGPSLSLPVTLFSSWCLVLEPGRHWIWVWLQYHDSVTSFTAVPCDTQQLI